VRYVREPRPGISHARNQGLDHARGALVAFIDDDETASPGWLRHLLDTQAAHDADIVLAPVLFRLDATANDDATTELRAFYDCTIDAPTGSAVGSSLLTPPWARRDMAYPRLASGNALLSRRRPALRQARFDPRLGLIGGEDTLFFNELVAAGARVVWCAEAVAVETGTRDRLSPRHVAARAFRLGQITAWVPLLLRRRRPLLTVWAMVAGSVQLACHGTLWAANALRGSSRRFAHMHRTMLALGKLLWMSPFRRRAYGQVREVDPGTAHLPPASGAEETLRLTCHANTAQSACPPELSVLIPFCGDDPVPVVRALAAQGAELAAAIEIVLFDDGSPDAALCEHVRGAITGLPVPVRLISASHNRGRAAARNALAQAARGRWALYLDADMGVDPGFLARHLAAARSDAFDAASGGCKFEPAPNGLVVLHAAVAAANDVGSVETRTRLGARAVLTGNLLVRLDVVRATPFDEGFRGWGWEDMDWAVRAARRYRLTHIDNPARRLPSDTAGVLLAKYRAAAPNFARLLGKAPELHLLPSARAARFLARVPGQRRLRGLWAAMVRTEAMPLRLRVLALKLWRASWAAEALGGADGGPCSLAPSDRQPAEPVAD
jgi:glycosyltransferase involved in cell wall biosynthesis